MIIEFLLTTLIVCASPGTGALYTISAGLTRGPRAALVAALAGTLGVVPHILDAMAGLAALLHDSALAFDMVKYAGVAFLLYMAWQELRAGGVLTVDAHTLPRSTLKVLVDGVLLNLLNPKLSIFFVAFLPQFMDTQRGDTLAQMTLMSGVFMLVTFLVFAVYGLAAGSMRKTIAGRPSVVLWLRRSFAAAFGVMAARLAVQER
ncbi:MAG: LysE family translocator [Beijerinckiaceae bacterium]